MERIKITVQQIAHVLFTNLLHSKYLMIEVALKLLIGQIDTKLLKAIVLKILEPEDVQNADIEVCRGGVGLQVSVKSRHYPLEHPGIECLGQSVPGISCLGACVLLIHLLT